MREEKRRALEAAGFRVGDAEDFLELTEEERQLVELRMAISRAVRARREQMGLTQQQVANRLKTSQPRFAKIEAGTADVSLDAMFRGLFLLGGGLEDLAANRSAPLSAEDVVSWVNSVTDTGKARALKVAILKEIDAELKLEAAAKLRRTASAKRKGEPK